MSAPAAAPERSRVDEREFFLPDFCAARAVLAIVLIAALLGFVLALARQSGQGTFWFDLARTTAFLLWAGLLCAAVLCRSRSWLAGKSLRASIAWSLALMVGTVALLSEAVYLLGRLWTARLGAPSAILPDSHWSFVLPNVLIAAVVGALALRYFYVSQQWRRSVELEARARIHALQARIRPHFLFNSMNTIAVADAVESGAGRGSDRGPVRPVPRQPERRARADHARGRGRDRAHLPADRAVAPGRPAAGALGRR